MEIAIDEKAKNYIKEKSQDNSINIVYGLVGAGWGASFKPLVKMGKPKDLKDFKSYEVEDVNVYIKETLAKKGEIRISLSRFLWLKSLEIEGLKP